MKTVAPSHRPSWRPVVAVRTCLAVAALGAFFAAAACGDPCRDLSDNVCSCMPTRAQAQACRKRVHALAAQSARHAASRATEAEQNLCHNLLQSCSCERLAQGDFSACGLAED